MKSIETEGDTIDEAIERALNALQVGRDRVEIEILADASRGLFGFGGKKARVRATVRPPLSALGGERLTDADSRETSRRSTSTKGGSADRSGSPRSSGPR